MPRRVLALFALLFVIGVGGLPAAHAEETDASAEAGTEQVLASTQLGQTLLKRVAAEGGLGDAEAVVELVRSSRVDAWWALDDLCRRGHVALALAVAEMLDGPDTADLPAYVRSRDDAIEDHDSAKQLAKAQRQLAEGDPVGAMAILGQIGELASPVLAVESAMTRGRALHAQRNLWQGEESFLKAADLAEELGWLSLAADAIGEAVQASFRRGNLRNSRRFGRRHLSLQKRRGDERGRGLALRDLGDIALEMGNLPKAQTYLADAVQLLEKVGRTGDAARPLMSQGVVQMRLGRFGESLTSFEACQKVFERSEDYGGTVRVKGHLAALELARGEEEHAAFLYDEALEQALVENLPEASASLGLEFAALESNRGNLAAAELLLERCRQHYESIGAQIRLARVHQIRGDILLARNKPEAAVEVYERALALAQATGNHPQQTHVRASLAEALVGAGRGLDAREMIDQAVRKAEQLRVPGLLVTTLQRQAWLERTQGDFQAAMATARRALPHFERLAQGHAQEVGAKVRARYASVFHEGALAAAESGDAEWACWFLEHGRAGTLLEAMGGRGELRRAALPEDLVIAEDVARLAELEALASHQEALQAAQRSEIKAAARVLDEARSEVLKVMQRIQRHEKERARYLFYPRSATLEDVQGMLEDDEAFVAYGLFTNGAVALIVTPDESRAVPLGPSHDLGLLCEAVLLEDVDVDVTEAVNNLRAAVVAPLKIPAECKRILLSPSGPLCYMPGSILFPDHSITSQASATTYALLREDRRERGKGVLALGDPNYSRGGEGGASRFATRGIGLVPLPGTRREVESIGDTVLVGPAASVEGLEAALAAHDGRWRAVHLACHGIVDTERPTLSALALSPTATHAGFLRALDVFRMSIPADLAVLSACETGKGKVVEGEGILGLTRAFLYAGSSGVLVSLWKVDDEATQALMRRFYELWNPKEGEGLDASDALRQAQAFVRGHEKWSHPYYWAAWILWGLPS